MDSAARHRCMIYAGSPAKQLPYLARLLAEQLQAGARCLYLNSPSMVDAMRAQLSARGVDVESLLSRGALVFSSDQSHIINGRFDAPSLLRALTSFIARSHAAGYERVWCSGDMTYEMGDHSNLRELLNYERALEQLFHLHPGLTGVCQYHQDTLPTSALRDALCSHQSVYINQTLFRLNPYFAAPEQALPTHIPVDIKDLIERFAQHQ